MKHFSWILTLPFAVVIVVFSVRNIANMAIDPWPFGPVVTWPTYLVVLLAVLFGFFFGAAIMWLSGHDSRREARRQRAEVRRLSREIESLRREAETRAAATSPGTRLPAATLPRQPATAGD